MLRWLTSFLWVCLACSAREPVASEQAAIVGGTLSPASQDAVVLLLTEMSDASGLYVENCTATLVAPNLVLTARHCISQMPKGTFTCNADGGVTGTSGTYGTDALPANSLVFVGATAPATFTPSTAQASGVKYFHGSEATVCNDDIALVEITPPINTAPIAPLSFDDAVTQGEQLTTVGWGATEDADLPSTRMERAGVSVVTVGPGYVPPGGELGDREAILSESVCSGDSGGPAFDETGNLVAVVSRGPVNTLLPYGQGCIGTQHVFTQVAPFESLIATAFTAAGDTLPLPDAGSEASDADATPPTAQPPPSGGCTLAAHDDASTLLGLSILVVMMMKRRPQNVPPMPPGRTRRVTAADLLCSER